MSENNNTSKSKRIASNSLLLFTRMLVITVINLYAVRLLLKALGQEDYGTFNAVAGVVLASTFITIPLAISIQRFYSYALGEGKTKQISDIFSASMNIIFALSTILLILIETAGLWFVNTQLAIPSERIVAANWIYQCSVGALWLSLIQLPYTAAIFANEDMGIFALISLTECLLRLVVVLLIGFASYDGLTFYGAGLFVVSVIIFFLYSITAHHRYPECRYHSSVQHGIYKALLSFSGWTMYSALANVGLTQGITILLYMFFGPFATAAYAVSLQVMHAFQTLSNSVVVAFRPAMIKSFAEKNHAFLNKMFTANNKFILYLLLMVAIPLILELRTIFGWWLDSVSESAIIYTRLIIIYMVCFSMHNPITTIVQSTGKVKNYSLWVDSVLLLCIPATWLAFHLGAPSYTCLAIMILMCLVAHTVRLIILRHLYSPFHYYSYIYGIVLPGLLVTTCITTVAFLVHDTIQNDFGRFVAVFATSSAMMPFAVYVIGLTKDEHLMIKSLINKRKSKV